ALQAASFPLPAIDGKALAVSEKQKTFRLPMRFEKVRTFYDEQFGKEKDVSMKLEGTSGKRVLALSTKRKGDRWSKAKVKDGELETVVEVTPVLEGDEQLVSGTGTPLVQFVFERSPDAQRAVEQTQDPLLR